MMQVTSNYTGDASKQQLTVKKGDIVSIVKVYPKGWSLVQDSLNNIGYIPTSYTKERLEQRRESTTTEAQHPKEAIIVKALYKFQGKDGQLSFKAGDRIVQVATLPSGWSSGYLESQHTIGLFPTSYVQGLDILDRAGSQTNLNGTGGQTNPNDTLTKIGESKKSEMIRTDHEGSGNAVIKSATTKMHTRNATLEMSDEQTNKDSRIHTKPNHKKSTQTCKSEFCTQSLNEQHLEAKAGYCIRCSIFQKYRTKIGTETTTSLDKQRTTIEKNRLMYLMLAKLSKLRPCSIAECDNMISGEYQYQFCSNHFSEYFFVNEYIDNQTCQQKV